MALAPTATNIGAKADVHDAQMGGLHTRFGLPHLLGMGVMVIATTYFLLPLYWILVASTKSRDALLNSFGFWFSGRFDFFANLGDLGTYDDGIYVRWLANTALYALVAAVLGAFLSSMAGFALAKYVFRGRDLVFSIILGAILVPSTALVLPLYLLMSSVNLTNTYWSVLLPSMVSPFGVYLSRIYAAGSVPDDLLDAARVDGAGEFRTFTTVALRIMSPALVTVFLFQLVAVWTNYFLPLVMLSDPNLFPITVGLQTWFTTSGTNQLIPYNLVVIGSLISVIPLVLGFLFLQRFWRTGLTAGGVRG